MNLETKEMPQKKQGVKARREDAGIFNIKGKQEPTCLYSTESVVGTTTSWNLKGLGSAYIGTRVCHFSQRLKAMS